MRGSKPNTTIPNDGFVLIRERILARRWGKSIRTLQRWRAGGYGPAYLLIGGSVLYRMTDVLDFENRQCRVGGVDQ